MKKTIASLAILASASSAMAMVPELPQERTKVCLRIGAYQDGSKVASDCDETRNNEIKNRKILENGCAAKQVALYSYSQLPISACLPPGVVQL